MSSSMTKLLEGRDRKWFRLTICCNYLQCLKSYSFTSHCMLGQHWKLFLLTVCKFPSGTKNRKHESLVLPLTSVGNMQRWSCGTPTELLELKCMCWFLQSAELYEELWNSMRKEGMLAIRLLWQVMMTWKQLVHFSFRYQCGGTDRLVNISETVTFANLLLFSFGFMKLNCDGDTSSQVQVPGHL